MKAKLMRGGPGLQSQKGPLWIAPGPVNQQLFWKPPWSHHLAKSSETLFLLRDSDSKGLPETGGQK